MTRDVGPSGGWPSASPSGPAERWFELAQPQGQWADSGADVRVVAAVAPQVRGQLGDRTEQQPCAVRWGISEGVEPAGHCRGDGGLRATGGLQHRLRPGEWLALTLVELATPQAEDGVTVVGHPRIVPAGNTDSQRFSRA